MSLSKAELRVLEHLVHEADERLAAGDKVAADNALCEAEAMNAEHPVALRLRAELLWDGGDDVRAEDRLRRALAIEPDDAEAHHLLAMILEGRDDWDGMVEHNLEVHRIDAALDRRVGIGTTDDSRFIEDACRRVLDRVPQPFAGKLANVPVVLEARPHRGVVEDGFDPRAVGMFEGTESGGELAVPDRPTRIVIYVANLVASCRTDAELEEQVEVTVLHEIGHFFGLDEDGVAALGLE